MSIHLPSVRRAWGRTAAVFAAVASLSTALAGVAGAAAPQPQGTRVTSVAARPADAVEHFGNMATGGCLDDSFAYGFRGFGCNGLDFQNWNVHIWQEDGTRQFRSIATNRCWFGGVPEGAHPYTTDCNSSKEQSWWVHARGDRVSFENQATGLCLDDSEYGLRMLTCTYNRNQTWR
ncbi:ricin-type beta-trefoil lectin domain protein [Streptomyces sp. NPDC001795]|uniref:RICIN domain-containing protein n=1 Tax=Streptomyces sp. NPDC001795 TaxID=3154525 RepID=UPI0033338AF1